MTEQGTRHAPEEEKDNVQLLVRLFRKMCSYRENTQTAQLELKLASVLSDNKGFSKCVNSKRQSKQNIGLVLIKDSHLTSTDEEQVGSFNAFFA